jgi:hypothetical protein
MGHDLREVIMMHAEMTRKPIEKAKFALKMAEKEMKKMIEKKKAHEIIRHSFNVSPRSCCPKLFTAILSDRPVPKHNKPLSHMIRPV